MHNILIKTTILFFALITFRCSEILINDDSYNSIYLKGGGWIQYQAEDLDLLNNNFSLEMWVSGADSDSDDSSMLVSILNNNNEIIFGLSRDISVDDVINLYIDNQMVQSIQNDDIDWSSGSFNLITISSDNDVIKIHINKEEVHSVNYDLQIGTSDFIVGARVNDSQTIASNFWYGYIDEIRLWGKALSDDEIAFHIDNPTKLVSFYGCDNSELTNITDCQEAGGVWSGGYGDDFLTNLKGLWRFNYNSPQLTIEDESCRQLNLDLGVSGSSDCQYINGTIYTLPNYTVEFSKTGI